MPPAERLFSQKPILTKPPPAPNGLESVKKTHQVARVGVGFRALPAVSAVTPDIEPTSVQPDQFQPDSI
jgi:hypothetical protein